MSALIDISSEETTTSKTTSIDHQTSKKATSINHQTSNVDPTSNVVQTSIDDRTASVDDDFKVTLAATYLDDALLNRHIEFR
jgi:hypothetical protein